jgi:uncharacterized small protein (DUF1192 family)
MSHVSSPAMMMKQAISVSVIVLVSTIAAIDAEIERLKGRRDDLQEQLRTQAQT